jgi:hypothetical protein
MTVDIDLKKVEAFAAQGMTNEQIKDALGIGRSTYFNKKKNDKDFRDAIKNGQAKGIATITNALFNNAKSGNLGAQCFYLKNRAGWKDKTENEVSLTTITPILPEYLRDAD